MKDVQYVSEVLGTPTQDSSSIMIFAGSADYCHIYVDTFRRQVLDAANVSETANILVISFTCDRAIEISFIGPNGGYDTNKRFFWIQ